MKISKLAKSAGVNIETVRFYERKGLITQPAKPSTGYRLYSKDTLARILFIKRAKELGFSLNEIASLLDLNSYQCHAARELVTNKLTDIRHKIQHLQQMESVLDNLVKNCDSNTDPEHCPIVASLQPKLLPATK